MCLIEKMIVAMDEADRAGVDRDDLSAYVFDSLATARRNDVDITEELPYEWQ
jgi:hypothetical protein